jgi:hypothetical protein
MNLNIHPLKIFGHSMRYSTLYSHCGIDFVGLKRRLFNSNGPNTRYRPSMLCHFSQYSLYAPWKAVNSFQAIYVLL